MTRRKYLGLRVTPRRRVFLSAIAAYSDATYKNTAFINAKHENVEPYVSAICNALGLDSGTGNSGRRKSAINFALKSTFIRITKGEQIKAKEDETALELALRATAEQIGE